MKPDEHIKRITDEIKQMQAEGHLNDFEVSAAAGGVEYEVGNLKIELEKLKDENAPDSPDPIDGE